MVHALVQRPDPWSYVLFVRSQDEEWLDAFAGLSNVSLCTAAFPHYSFAEQMVLPRLLRQTGCTLFYAPHFNVPFFCPVPSVVTVHDLILHRYPNQANLLKRLAYRLLLWRALGTAEAVVTVSDTTKAELSQLYPAHALKMHRIYPGVGQEFQRQNRESIDAIRRKYHLPSSFLLYVGNTKQHKNIEVLLSAFLEAKLDTDLVLIIPQSANVILPHRVHRLADVRAADLPALYSAAAGCVTATLCEGFGLPMVEAMACGCPVLGTTIPSLQEICGTHALLFSPTVQDFAAGLRTLASDPSVHDAKRLDAAMQHARSFDWHSSAGQISQLFTSLLRRYGPTL